MTTSNWRYTVPLLAIGSILSTTASFVLARAWLTPILGAVIAYPVFLYWVSHRQYRNAAMSMLLWALFQSLAIGIGTAWFPETAAEVDLVRA